ncbi:hypothetical protein [Acrocarpospora pleiomorpha]|uniref:hypothetical protein n=1 Tax=Acrocarpospora pleiomorpha TaxID=90975 RepID=UPI004039A4FE
MLDAGDTAVLAHRADIDGGTVLAVHNFADRKIDVELTLDGLDSGKVLTDLLLDGTIEISDEGVAGFDLEPYGCRWFRASTPETAPADSTSP